MRLRVQTLLFILAVLSQPCLTAQDGAAGALRFSPPQSPLEGGLAIAHLDRDSSADGAVLFGTTPYQAGGPYRVEIHLTNRPNSKLTFDSAEQSAAISTFDVDHDKDADIVVSRGVDEPGVRVWLNDGKGEFQEGHVQDYPTLVHPTREKIRPAKTIATQSLLGLPATRELPAMAGGTDVVIDPLAQSTLFPTQPGAAKCASLFWIPASLRGPPSPPSSFV